ncbi:hypothetical protein K505DRAFT_232379 [Melanomma pulvis-pyrius CBS 109.77]|uniref:CPAF-like PDZ domain-containing protein n=1 Tax=Melanomma pulvis-pyrius CBS 109.77 TaxID=1314802 RepID=A0A6A6XS45_9PLEO|nr:hypothetical protein K505DRAFT_232379 [Melanomma pulvis-pyrius CBS 109.77]
MRSISVLPALVAAVSAQAQSFAFGTSGVLPSATAPSAPGGTGSACAQVADLVIQSQRTNPSVDAELAYACLKSVPIDTTAASDTIASVKQLMQFQSTLAYLKDPPEGYANEGVDIMGGLDDINTKVGNGGYDNEFDFENDVSMLIAKAHDGHMYFDGMASSGVFRWRRSGQIALISASSDGKEAPKVWVLPDYNSTGYKPSPVTKIGGKDAMQFLEEESAANAYHDPDTRYNSMFYLQPAESLGYFVSPRFYPGASVDLEYENGTKQTYTNKAVVMDYQGWSSIFDGQSFYNTYITPNAASAKLKKRDPFAIPRHLQHVREPELSRRTVPDTYPAPVIQHTSEEVPLAGYFINTSVGTIGVLMVQTFSDGSAAGNDDAREFQKVVQEYIVEAKSRNVVKHIIDVRTNGGGKVILGYDMYLQFFPSQRPQLLSRYRGHQASDLIGTQLSTLSFRSSNGGVYTSPFNFHSYLNKDLQAFTEWKDMYPPVKFHDDSFTNLLRYNLSDPLVTTSELYSIGITPTGYGVLSNYTEDPFKAEDIVIFSDGICASTCALFTELMVQQSGVKTIAVGGRPETGPMQPVGGTKGSLVLQGEYLIELSAYVVSTFSKTTSEAKDWTSFLPSAFSIAASTASVNFQDNIRKGLEDDGVPTQFLNDTASCRMWYQPTMYLNVTDTWTKVAEVAFGKDGGLNADACVSGSVTTKEEQQGQGEGNPSPTSPSGNGNTGNGGSGTPTPSGSKAAAASLGRPTSGWTAILVCSTVVLGSMLFGATLV